MIRYIISLLFILLLTACNSGNSTQSGKDSAQSDTVPNQDTIAEQRRLPASISLALTGDMMLGTDFPDESHGAYLPVDSGMKLFNDCRDIMRRVDYACGNLEGVLGHAGKPKDCNNPSLCFTFRMSEYLVRPLADAGIDYMNLANNHANDFGAAGAKSSYNVLKDAGIAGAGLLKESPYAIVERQGVKVGFTGFSTSPICPSVHDYAQLEEIIEEMRPKCDIIVVSMHAGGEGADYAHVTRRKEVFHGWPRGNVHEFAHKAIDLGADVIWGHGPHVLRGAEVYNDRLILYSLGNFCTPYRMGIVGPTAQAALAEINVAPDGRFLHGQLHSFLQQRGRGPIADKNNASALRIKTLSEQDFPESPLKISADGRLSVGASSD